MNFRQLEAFRAIMRNGTISAAASQLFTSQPSLSRTLMELEESVGFKLFRRHRRGMDPTEEARQFHEALGRTYFGLEELERIAISIRDLSMGHLRIGSLAAMAFQLIPDIITSTRQEIGDFGLTYLVRDIGPLVEQMHMGQLDLVLGVQPVFTSDLTLLGRWSFDNVCLLPGTHPLCASREVIDLTRLGDTPLIMFEDQYLTSIAPNLQSLEQLKSRAKISVSSSFAGAILVERGAGIAVIDPFTADYFAGTSDVVVKDIKQSFPCDVTLLAPKRAGGRLATHFADQIIAKLDDLHFGDR